MMKTTVSGLGVFLVLAAAVAMAGCGGGSGGGTCAAATANVTGVWAISETATSADSSCSGTDNYSLTGTQATGASAVTVTDTRGRSYSGTMCGNVGTASVPFSYAEDGGTTTISALSFTVTGGSLSGTSTWSWSDGSQSCSGSTTFTGTLQGG